MMNLIAKLKALWAMVSKSVSKFISWVRGVLKEIFTKRKSLHCNNELVFVQSNINMKPVSFHPTHGINIRLWINQKIALRSYDFCYGYVFMPEPMIGKESFVVVQVLEVDQCHLGSLAFGVTTKDPISIRPASLPSNTIELDDGKSYLVCSRITNSSVVGDVFIFYLNEKDEMCVKVNEKSTETLFPVQKGVPYWWFFDVYGSTRKIRAYLADKSEVRMLGLRVQQPELLVLDGNVEGQMRRADVDDHTLTLNCYLTRNGIRYEPVSSSFLRGTSTTTECFLENIKDPSTGYCIECFRSPCNNCMLYPCGHIILCYDCAIKLQKEHGCCPECNSTIENATPIYR